MSLGSITVHLDMHLNCLDSLNSTCTSLQLFFFSVLVIHQQRPLPSLTHDEPLHLELHEEALHRSLSPFRLLLGHVSP